LDWSWLIYFALTIVGFGVGFLITRHKDPLGENTISVIEIITTRFLDETSFRPRDIVKKQAADSKLTEEEVEKELNKLTKLGVLKESKGMWFRLEDNLVFLQPKDVQRAMRITKNDNLLYGGYSEPFLSNKFFYGIYAIFLGAIVVGFLVYFVVSFREFLGNLLPRLPGSPTGVENPLILPFILFFVAFSYVIVDALENVIQAYGRERYSVVVGMQSGISFDMSLADEFSGNIPRGMLRGVDLDISTFQKVYNYFATVPRGNVTVKLGGKKTQTFVNVPFPRELAYVIKSVMLKSLAWRKANAKTLMMWRARNSGVVVPGGN
jgi:hypothetical protein